MPTIDEIADRMPDLELGELEALLASDPGLVHARTSLGDTLLHEACWHDRDELVTLLIDAGADVNARGEHGRTPLHCAVNDAPAQEMVPLIRALRDAHAVVELEDELGFTVEETLLREAWDDPQPALDALGVAAPSHATTAQYWRTGYAIEQLLSAFRDQLPLHAEPSSEVDDGCVRDLQSVLALIASTSWAAPLRTWLRTRYKPNYANRIYAIYSRR